MYLSASPRQPSKYYGTYTDHVLRAVLSKFSRETRRQPNMHERVVCELPPMQSGIRSSCVRFCSLLTDTPVLSKVFYFCLHGMCIEAGGWANLEVEEWKGESGESCTRRESFAQGRDGTATSRSQGGQVQLPHRRAFFFV